MKKAHYLVLGVIALAFSTLIAVAVSIAWGGASLNRFSKSVDALTAVMDVRNQTLEAIRSTDLALRSPQTIEGVTSPDLVVETWAFTATFPPREDKARIDLRAELTAHAVGVIVVKKLPYDSGRPLSKEHWDLGLRLTEIEGIMEVRFTPYRILLKKAPKFEWAELEPVITELLKQQFPDQEHQPKVPSGPPAEGVCKNVV